MFNRKSATLSRRLLKLTTLLASAALLMGGCGDSGDDEGTTFSDVFDTFGDAVQNALDRAF